MKISKRNLKKIVQEEIASVLNFDLSKGPSDKTAVASMLLETALGIVPSYKQVREHLKKEKFNSLAKQALPIYREYIDFALKDVDSRMPQDLHKLVEHKITIKLEEKKFEERCVVVDESIVSYFKDDPQVLQEIFGFGKKKEAGGEKKKGFFGKMKDAGAKVKQFFTTMKDMIRLSGVAVKAFDIVLRGGEFSEKDKALMGKVRGMVDSSLEKAGAYLGVKKDQFLDATAEGIKTLGLEAGKFLMNLGTGIGSKVVSFAAKRLKAPIDKLKTKAQEAMRSKMDEFKAQAVHMMIKYVSGFFAFIFWVISAIDPTGVTRDIADGLSKVTVQASELQQKAKKQAGAAPEAGGIPALAPA